MCFWKRINYRGKMLLASLPKRQSLGATLKQPGVLTLIIDRLKIGVLLTYKSREDFKAAEDFPGHFPRFDSYIETTFRTNLSYFQMQTIKSQYPLIQ